MAIDRLLLTMYGFFHFMVIEVMTGKNQTIRLNLNIFPKDSFKNVVYLDVMIKVVLFYFDNIIERHLAIKKMFLLILFLFISLNMLLELTTICQWWKRYSDIFTSLLCLRFHFLDWFSLICKNYIFIFFKCR